MLFAILGMVLVCAPLLPGTRVLAQPPSATTPTRYEQRARQTVRAWIAAFGARDADKAAAYFEDDVQFRMEAALNRNIETGRDNARQQLRRLFERVSRAVAAAAPGPHVQAGSVQLLQTEAIGGSKEVLVITRRIDNITLNGRPLHLPVGSFFRVNAQDGKIEEWLDIPLIAFNRNPAPPAGQRPQATGARGAGKP
ncbi:MAG TPA: nuclear transport factor 2 family protein [Steroidobacteraceae bacterium]|nr:nuclear transport factor 2 family protein [Steroidobacteraceae bacterium]